METQRKDVKNLLYSRRLLMMLTSNLLLVVTLLGFEIEPWDTLATDNDTSRDPKLWLAPNNS